MGSLVPNPSPLEPAAATDHEIAAHLGARNRTRRIVITSITIAVALAVAIPLFLWTRYRVSHVVSRNALVKGHISDVGVRVDGVVTQIRVNAGDHVEAGSVLARLEDRHFKAQVERARSRLEKATRELQVERLEIAHERLRLETSVSEAAARLAASQAQMEAAEITAQNAREEYALRKSLAERGVIPSEELRDAQAKRNTAEALATAATAQHNEATALHRSAQVNADGMRIREERITVFESEIASLKAELAVAEADVEATVIRAPDDGYVVRRIVEPGASVVVGQPLVSFWIGGDVWVEAWIDENDLADVSVGSVANVTLQPYPEQLLSGVVESIGVSTDYELPDSEVPQPRHVRMRGTPVVGVRVRLDESKEKLFPGLSAVVAIRKNSR